MSVPVARRIVSHVRDTDRIVNVLVEVDTDDGLTGASYVAGFTPQKARATCWLLDEMDAAVRGLDASAIGAAWDRMWASCALAGHTGLSTFALSAMDVALWDLHGKQLGVPLHHLLGFRRTELRAYASDGCWLQDDPSAVAAEAESFAAEGFRAVKVRFGRPDPERDLATLEAVRRAVGDGVQLLVDVNQGWTREQARRFGPRLAECDATWLEEPLACEDVAGLAELRRVLPVPITAGENAYLPDGIKALLDAAAVSTAMPDLQRVGGITGWVRASALAEAAHVSITSHLFPEVSIHLLAAAAQPGPLEWVTWMSPLLEEPLEVRGGVVHAPETPGLGIAFDAAAVRRHQID